MVFESRRLLNLKNMNFIITLLGWFLWNWAEFSITKEKGDGFEFAKRFIAILGGYAVSDDVKKSVETQLSQEFNKPETFRDYMRGHYETWVGSFVCMFVLLIIGYRQLDINPIGLLIGVETNGWNDVYLFGAGAAWDIVIFMFKRVKSLIAKKG